MTQLSVDPSTVATPPTIHGPARAGRHVLIRPVRPPDYEWLYEVALFTPAGSHWRLHGEAPPFDQFVVTLFQGARATFVIQTLHEGERVGMVQLWDHQGLSRHAQLTAFLAPDFVGKGWPFEGIALCADYAFKAFDLRKLYVETLDSELPQFASLVGTVLEEEGCLRGHRWVMGEYLDCHILALYRERFEALASQLLPVVREPAYEETLGRDLRPRVGA